MIDLGLSKLALIGAVALIVIGPEKLPKVARLAGSLFGRAQRYINEVKSEVSREIELEEFRKMHKDMREAASNVENTIARDFSSVTNDLKSAWNEESDTLHIPSTPEHIHLKAKEFRRKKLAQTSAIPSWYKRQNGYRTYVTSGAARVARYRPAPSIRKSFH